MTNFIYEREDYVKELEDAMKTSSLNNYITLRELLDHIEAQGKQLRELNAAITKRNATIEKYEHKNKDLRERNALLLKKVDELNEGIRDSEDLTWKQKYDALLHSSEQAIGALQKKCQEYKNTDADAMQNKIATLEADNDSLRILNENMKGVIKSNYDYISELEDKVKGLEAANEKLLAQDRVCNCVISLSSDLNTKIDNQSKEITRLLRKQERLKAAIKSKDDTMSQRDRYCGLLLEKIRELRKELDFWKGSDTFSTASYLTKRCNKAEETLSKIRDLIDGKE